MFFLQQIYLCYSDDGVSFSSQQGLVASRSKVYFFKHNDMVDLERVLKLQARYVIHIALK